MTSPPGSKAAQHFATFMGKLVSLFHFEIFFWASWCQFFTHFETFFETFSSLCSAGAPPGANGHPVPITYEGFALLTDNYNNYFMSSFIPQVKTILTQILKKKNLFPCTVQLLPGPGLSDQPVPTEALF